MAPFKPGLGMLVAGTDVPVVPCHLGGCFEALAPGRRCPRPRRIRVRVGEPLTFAAVANDRAGWVHVAAAAEERVRALATDPT
jgi:1-acyl-sn-glycerol-3-phosphate acyltransferase